MKGEQGMGTELFAIRLGSRVILDRQAGDDPERGASIGREATRLIRTSPIVGAEPEGALDGRVYQWRMRLTPLQDATQRTAIQFENKVSFTCHWPPKNQEFVFDPPYGGPCAEEFVIVYDGFVYAVACRCDVPFARPYSFIFGREGGRVLDAILSPSDLWDLHRIGPCPMFPVIYLAFSDDAGSFSLGRDLISEGDTLESLYVLERDQLTDVGGAVRRVLESLLEPADVHYSCVEERIDFICEQVALYERMNEAMQACGQLTRGTRWTPRGWVGGLLSQGKLRRAVGGCYQHYVALEEARARVTSVGREAKEAFGRHPLLQPHEHYTAEVVEDVFEWQGHHVLEALRFLADESRSRGLEVATLVGPLIGAVIALAATALALWLGS